MGWRGCGLGQKRRLTQTIKRGKGKISYRRAQGFIIIQDSSSNVLLGIQDAAGANGTAGEWSFPSRTTALVQFLGNSCAGFVCFRFVGGSERSRCCIPFFFLPFPADTHRDDSRRRTVLHRFYSLTAAVRVAKGRRGPGADRQDGGYAHVGAHCSLLAHSLIHSLGGIGEIHEYSPPLWRRRRRCCCCSHSFGQSLRWQLLRLLLVLRQAQELTCKT